MEVAEQHELRLYSCRSLAALVHPTVEKLGRRVAIDGKITLHSICLGTSLGPVPYSHKLPLVVSFCNPRSQVAPLHKRGNVRITDPAWGDLHSDDQERRKGFVAALQHKSRGRPRLDPDPGRVLFSDRRSARLLCAKSKPTPEVKTRCAACFTFPRRKTCRIVIGFRAVDSLRNPGIKHGLHSQNSPYQRASPAKRYQIAPIR